MLVISFTRVSAPDTLAHVTNESFFDVVAVGKKDYPIQHHKSNHHYRRRNVQTTWATLCAEETANVGFIRYSKDTDGGLMRIPALLEDL